MCEYLSVLINTSVLHRGSRMIRNVSVGAQTSREKEDLRLEGPLLHVLIEIREVRVLRLRFKEGRPLHSLRQELNEGGLADTDIPCHRDEVTHFTMLRLSRPRALKFLQPDPIGLPIRSRVRQRDRPITPVYSISAANGVGVHPVRG